MKIGRRMVAAEWERSMQLKPTEASKMTILCACFQNEFIASFNYRPLHLTMFCFFYFDSAPTLEHHLQMIHNEKWQPKYRILCIFEPCRCRSFINWLDCHIVSSTAFIYFNSECASVCAHAHFKTSLMTIESERERERPKMRAKMTNMLLWLNRQSGKRFVNEHTTEIFEDRFTKIGCWIFDIVALFRCRLLLFFSPPQSDFVLFLSPLFHSMARCKKKNLSLAHVAHSLIGY